MNSPGRTAVPDFPIPTDPSIRPRAILFDFYGTLTSACTRGPAHDLVPKLLGAEPAEYFAVLDTSFYPRCRGDYGGSIETMRWVADQLGLQPTENRLRAAQAARIAAVRADTWLREEAVPVLWRLRRAGIKIAVISDCAWELPEIMLSLPVHALLDVTTYSVHLGRSKPDPLLYHYTCNRLGVDPGDCVFIGDGGSGELSGAARLGIRAIRLAAPDLADHLVFGRDDGFVGESARTLTEAARMALREPSLV